MCYAVLHRYKMGRNHCKEKLSFNKPRGKWVEKELWNCLWCLSGFKLSIWAVVRQPSARKNNSLFVHTVWGWGVFVVFVCNNTCIQVFNIKSSFFYNHKHVWFFCAFIQPHVGFLLLLGQFGFLFCCLASSLAGDWIVWCAYLLESFAHLSHLYLV